MNEIWKDIDGYEGLYEISNLGRVKSLPRNGTIKDAKILKYSVNKYGYYTVYLNKNGIQKTFTLHRLVAIAFINNHDNKKCIDHINTIKTDNSVENLRWVTVKENNNNPLTLIKHIGKKHSSITKNKIKEKAIGKNNSNSTKIKQFDLNYNFIKLWDCMKDVEMALGIKHNSIGACCRGNLENNKKKRFAKGFIWEYADKPKCKKRG